MNAERGSVGQADAHGGGRRGGRGRGTEVSLAEHPDPIPTRGSGESLPPEEVDRINRRLERWGFTGN